MKVIELEERKNLQLDILKNVDTFCKEHHLTYYLAFGTLIGAIRHKGYIPWDDDIDIMMPRKDYEQFEAIFPSDCTFKFLTQNNTQNYPYAYGKIIDTRTVKKEPVRRKYQVIGLDIDVFPIDYYPNDLQEAESWCNEIYETQMSLENQILQFKRGDNIGDKIYNCAKVAIRQILDDLSICSVNRTVGKLICLSQKYNHESSNYCGISAISTYGVRKRNRKEVFDSAVEVEFEGYRFLAPVGYDEYLSDIYGDYMQLPPVEKRVTHHSSIVYWK